MSTAFTTPADATWQTLLDEITLAYSERRQAIGQSAYIPIDGKDVQSRTYWAIFQNELEINCSYFIDHSNGPINPTGDDFLSFTLATWRAAAGLNASGFRRATEWDGVNDPAWSYGWMQAGDIIGPWIFEDIQNGLSALRWTTRAASSNLINRFNTSHEESDDCGTNLAAQNADWAAFAWGAEQEASDLYTVDQRKEYDHQHWMSGRTRGKARLLNIPTNRPHEADLYLLPYFWNSGDGGSFYDFDSTGYTNNQLALYTTFADAMTDSRVSDYLGNITTNPNAILGWGCPVPSGNYQCNFGVYPKWLLKWNFTNQN